MAKKGSIIYQTKMRFRELDAIGTKKPKDSNLIHGIQTMRTYLNHALKFVTYCRDNYGCKSLEDCKPYIKEYIEGNNCSPSVKKVQRSALAKMYGVKSSDLGNIATGRRSRASVKRSRGSAIRDKHFNEKGKYKPYVDFCRATGLRKVEVESLLGTSFFKDEKGNSFLKVTKNTKGGRFRTVPVLKEYASFVEEICSKAGNNKVIQYIASDRLKAPNGADTHSYRANYAKSLYDRLKRPLDQVPTEERYFCRNELKGIVYDRKAMEQVSQALGHTRVSVIAQSYLHGH